MFAFFSLPGFPRKLRPTQRCKAFPRYWRHGQIRSVLSRHLPQFSLFKSWNICAKMMTFKNVLYFMRKLKVNKKYSTMGTSDAQAKSIYI